MYVCCVYQRGTLQIGCGISACAPQVEKKKRSKRLAEWLTRGGLQGAQGGPPKILVVWATMHLAPAIIGIYVR